MRGGEQVKTLVLMTIDTAVFTLASHPLVIGAHSF
jgi:hypothetical protein